MADILEEMHSAENKRPQTLEEYNKELELGVAEIEAGAFVINEDVVKYFSKK